MISNSYLSYFLSVKSEFTVALPVLQSMESAATLMIQEARQLAEDLRDIRYLDDLIFLLQGQLDRISLRKWPFLLAHILPHKDSTQELNLVV